MNLGTRRGASQWRLLIVVLVISLVSCTLVTALSVVSTATESRAVSGSLASTSPTVRQLRVSISAPTISFAEARDAVPAALGALLHGTATTTQSDRAFSTMLRVDRPSSLFALAYLGELDDLDAQVNLVAGSWPTSAYSPSGAIDVALPESGLAPLRVKLGDTFSTDLSRSESIELHVVGVYSDPENDSPYWQTDVLEGAALDPRYPVPGTAGALLTDAVGPLVVAPGTLDASAVPLERIVIRADPSFSGLTIDNLIPVTNSFATASQDVPVALGEIGGGVFFTSSLSEVFASVASALTSTRSTVVLVSLLLLVLAIVAVAQTARLMVEARAGERSLLRARGSTVSQLLWPSLLEALAVILITAAISPVLARYVYQAVAAQPALVSAGVPRDPGLSPSSWIVSAIAAVIFGIVLILPLFRSEGTFHEGEQGRARQRRASGIQRSGIDLAVLALAGVAYWQLLSYRTAVGDGATLRVDPVIAGAPALVLLAGGLLSVRFVPFAAALAERLAVRGRGIVASLAAWEVSRRAQRATAALLLLTLALAVGTFSLSYLATWQESQSDQARLAIGAPVRVSAPGQSALEVRTTLPAGYTGSPQPTLRRGANLAAAEANFSGQRSQTGPDLTLLATTADARAMLDRDRVAEEGGSQIAATLPSAVGAGGGVALGTGVKGIRATFGLSSDVPALAVRANVRALIEDASGVLSTVDMGPIIMNDEAVMSGAVDPNLDGQLRLVGVQLVLYADEVLNGQSANPESPAVLTMRDLTVLDRSPDTAGATQTPVQVDPSLQWYTSADWFSEFMPKGAFQPENAQFGLRFTVRANIRSTIASFTAFTWEPVTTLPAIFTRDLAATLRAQKGDQYTLVLGDADVRIAIASVVPHIPGGGPTTSYNPLTLGEAVSTTTANTIMVDQVQLARALAQAGVGGTLVNEWWLDVPDVTSAAYVDELAAAGVAGQSGAVLGTQVAQHPVRVATQGAIWLVALGAALIAALGFAIYATGSLRARNAEFAQLRAIGLSSRRLVGIVAVETTLLGLLGSIVGLGLGLALSLLVVPVVGVSANGAPPVPEVRILIPWDQLGLLAIEVGLVLMVVVVVAARVQRDIDPTTVLRRGD